MNDAHLHLVVNHLPIIFPLVGAIVLATGIISKSEPVKRTAFMVFVLGSIAAILAMNSGEGAEDVVKNITGISKDIIHEHEEKAEVFAVLAYILGGFSLIGLWASFKQKAFSNTIAIIVLIFTFVVLFFGKDTGTTGGEIRHTEIRSDFSVPIIENNDTQKHNE